MTKTVELFYDIASSYSYLAATQIDALSARAGAEVRWRPFLLGGVFKATGNEMPARIPNKAQWLIGDTMRWAKKYGVPYAVPSRFPMITISTQRALVATDRLVGQEAQKKLAIALFHAYWAEDRDVSDKAVIAEVAASVGLDASALLAALDAVETKNALRANTDEAVSRGAFGAPAMFYEGELFWGNDRLGLLEDALTNNG
ncbi:MAG: 2-hydroxychromene-2-carboxylate isomerase [Deltaproteobacteria bacterium]